MRKILAAAAAIVFIAGAASAQGNGHGNGGGGNGRGGGGEMAQGGGNGGGQGRGNSDGGRGNGRSADRGNGGDMVSPIRAEAPRGNGNGNGRGNRDMDRVNDDRGQDIARRGERGRDRDDDTVRIVRDVRDDGGRWTDATFRNNGLIDGCPPGLAKKSPACVPPGLARGGDRDGYDWNDPDFWGLRSGDGRYYYDDGYLLRYGPDGRIGSYIPLLGGALSIGNPWPSYYQPVQMPDYYQRYYGLGPNDSYRYADDVIYRVDPQTDLITSIAALLTGDQFSVGQRMPLGYDVYNVPYGYRDQYVDGPDADYRYSDGYVYQVDPKTQLIQAAIELLL